MAFSLSLSLSSLWITSYIPSYSPLRTVERIYVSTTRDVVCESSFSLREASLWAQGYKLDRRVRNENYVWKVLKRYITLAMCLSSRRNSKLISFGLGATQRHSKWIYSYSGSQPQKPWKSLVSASDVSSYEAHV
jgi:hypothetical protein